MQQIVRITAKRSIGHATDALLVQISIDPLHFPTGLLDHAKRTVRVAQSILVNNTKGHHGRAASSSDWNWRASPPWTKKLLGSCPSGRETRRAVMPCS